MNYYVSSSSDSKPPNARQYQRIEILRRLASAADDDEEPDGDTARLLGESTSWPGRIDPIQESQHIPAGASKETTISESQHSMRISSVMDLLNDAEWPDRLDPKVRSLTDDVQFALEQTKRMACMQIKIEHNNNNEKHSIAAEMIGITNPRKCKLSLARLKSMNLTELQLVVNDMLSIREDINRELIEELNTRDELLLEQDFILKTIETRIATEIK
jgi:hypothetical protein